MDTNAVIDAYIECALWSSSIGEDGLAILRANGVELPANAAGDEGIDRFGFSASDLDSQTRANVNTTVESFLRTAPADALKCWSDELGDSQIGHDLWLTQNGHGAGFWDRFMAEPQASYGRALTEHAKPYGEVYLYIGDDLKVHGS